MPQKLTDINNVCNLEILLQSWGGAQNKKARGNCGMEKAHTCPRDTAVLQIPCPGGGCNSSSDPGVLWGGRWGEEIQCRTQISPSLPRIGFRNCSLRFVALTPVSSYFTTGWSFLSYSHLTTPDNTPS